jgi:hypothetical protein
VTSVSSSFISFGINGFWTLSGVLHTVNNRFSSSMKKLTATLFVPLEKNNLWFSEYLAMNAVQKASNSDCDRASSESF